MFRTSSGTIRTSAVSIRKGSDCLKATTRQAMKKQTGLGAVILILCLIGPVRTQTGLTAVSDCCFVAGAVLLCYGLLILAANLGMFRLMAFGFKKLFAILTRTQAKGEYHEVANNSKRCPCLGYTVAGAVFLTLSAAVAVFVL